MHNMVRYYLPDDDYDSTLFIVLWFDNLLLLITQLTDFFFFGGGEGEGAKKNGCAVKKIVYRSTATHPPHLP